MLGEQTAKALKTNGLAVWQGACKYLLRQPAIAKAATASFAPGAVATRRSPSEFGLSYP